MLLKCRNALLNHVTGRFIRRRNYKFAEIDRKDVIEKFIHGSGPGGQKVNKSYNCVFLKHVPTGVHLKVHEYREVDKNHKLAWQKLEELVDEAVNGDNSYLAQKRHEEQVKSERRAVNKEHKKERMERKKQAKLEFMGENCDEETELLKS